MAGLIQCHLLQDCVLQHWLQELEGVLDIRHTVGGLYTAGIGKVCQGGETPGYLPFQNITSHYIRAGDPGWGKMHLSFSLPPCTEQ